MKKKCVLPCAFIAAMGLVEGWPIPIGPERKYIGDRHERKLACTVRAEASWSGLSSGSDTQQCVYQPDDGWEIIEYSLIVNSQNNGGHDVSFTGGAVEVATFSEIDAAYDELMDFAYVSDDDSLWTKLENKKKEHMRIRSLFKTSGVELVANAHARAHGSFYDRKRGWSDISVFVWEVYLGADRNSVKESLVKEFRIELTQLPAPAPAPSESEKPLNDICRHAEVLSVGEILEGSTVSATYESQYSGCGGIFSDTPGVWYRVHGTGKKLKATTCTGFYWYDGDFDSEITVYEGNPSCSGMMCIDVNDDDDTDECGSESSVTWKTKKNTEYFIHVTGDWSITGNNEFGITLREAAKKKKKTLRIPDGDW